MCTVTYFPYGNGYFLTSNRDEKNTRSTALEPSAYSVKNTQIIYPKDADANGTWIVLKENGDALCLLNGAFENFTPKDFYRKSRGLIVVEIAATNNIIETFKTIDLENIAPFTLIMVYNSLLYECRWDGASKHILQLNNNKPYIWSSATLYNDSQRQVREKWFASFMEYSKSFEQKNIINFHKNTGDGDAENDLVMNRNDKYCTVSITSIAVQPNNLQMHYQNLISNKIHTAKFENELAQV